MREVQIVIHGDGILQMIEDGILGMMMKTGGIVGLGVETTETKDDQVDGTIREAGESTGNVLIVEAEDTKDLQVRKKNLDVIEGSALPADDKPSKYYIFKCV